MTEHSSTDIRVFLSSTFSDMQETRNYLTRKIFPKIEQECARRGISFSVLDLRWGITESESKTGKVIEICIDEINRTRPFFIGLVGERYGWIPDEQEIRKNRHLEEKYPWVREYIGRRCSITEIEMQYGVLNNDSIQDAYFFLKKTRDGHTPQNEEEEKLSELRKTIMEKAGEGKCTADIYNSVEELGKLVHDRLVAMIEKRFPLYGRMNEYDLYYLREDGNLAVLRRNYIDLDNRVKYLESNIVHTGTMFVTGESGCGKSALLANSFINSNEIVVRTAIDASVNSIGRLISLFLYRLDPAAWGETAGTDEEETIRKYREHTYKEPVIWIIDGLEKLPVEDIYSIMPLLTPPENIRTVISVEEQYFRKNSISDLIHESYPAVVEPAPLNEAEKLLFVRNRLHECGKKLTERQEMHILSSRFLSNPQFLKIFVEELIQFGIYEKLDAFIERLATASDRRDFINRILEISENEFRAGEIETLLSVTAISSYGIGEKEYVSECGYTPLAYSALYGAAEPFIYRQDGALIIKNSELKTYILERYLNTTEKRDATARLCTKLLLKEKKRFNKRRELTFLERLIYKAIRFYPITDASQRFNKIHGELIMQYMTLGEWKKANKLLCNIFPSTIALGERYYPILCQGLENGLDIRRLFSVRNILLFNFAGRETMLFFSKVMFAFLAEYSAVNYKPLRRHFRLMPIPRRLKHTLIDIADKAFGKKADESTAGNFEERWIPGEYEMEPEKAAAIFEMISIVTDPERIKKISSAAEAMASASEKDSIDWLFFTSYSALCAAKSGNVETAKELFRSVLESSKVGPASMHYVKFAISYQEYDWQSCRELTKELRQWTATMPHRHKLLKFVICYRIATEEKDPDGGKDYSRKDAIAEYEKLAREENFSDSMNYFAQWLTAWQLADVAADVYARLADTAASESEKANYHYLMAESLESCHTSDWHAIAGIWEKSAGCYLQAGKEYYMNMDNALNNAIKAYNKVQDWTQAERLIVKRYGYANEMERDYGPEKMAERYNRIAIRCSELKNCPNPETKDITVASLKKSMSAKEDKILYLKNYIFNLDSITRKGWLAVDEVQDALGFIVPYAELDTAGECLPSLFFLGCYCRDEKLAAHSLEKAKELGITLGNAGYEWNSLVMKACSDNQAESLKSIETIKKRIMEHSEPYDWTDCRKLRLDKKIKDTCSHERCEDLLLLWTIAKLENNSIEAESLKSEIRKFAVDDNQTTVIDRFINLNSRFYANYTTIEWILFQIRLYMDWKPGYGTVTEWCLTSVSMAFNAKCSYHELEKLEPFYTECITAAENPSETLLEIAEGLPHPETGSISNDTECCLGIVKAVTAPLRNGIISLDESGHARLEKCVTKYLEPVTESPDSDNTMSDSLYDLYKSLNIKTNNKIVSAMLALRIPSLDEYYYGEGPGCDFFKALAESMAEGYPPDTDMLGSITWVYILHGDLQKAAESLSEFEAAVRKRKEYAPVLTFFRALMESGNGKYAGAAEKLHEILALIDLQKEYDDNYWIIPDIFIGVCRDDFCFEFVFCHSLVLGEIYAGLYKEGLEHSEMLVNYDGRSAWLLNCLVLYRSGLPEEAMRLLEKNRHEDDEDDEDTYTVRTLRLLVALEQARYCAGSGKMTEAAKIVRNAGEHIWKSMPPLCVHEYEQACRLLTDMQ